jgi:hypothetical protein
LNLPHALPLPSALRTLQMMLFIAFLLTDIGAVSKRSSWLVQVSKTSLGLLTGTFMAGYCLFSPVFAYVPPRSLRIRGKTREMLHSVGPR